MSFLPDERGTELLDLFFESSGEIIHAMNDTGLALEKYPGDEESLRRIRRAVHTLKGDSAACGFRELSELAHDLEDVFTPELAARESGLIPEVVLAAADTFHEMLTAYRNNLQPPSGSALREYIQRLLGKTIQSPVSSRKARFEWTEYEHLLISEASTRGETIYHVALHLDPEAPLPAAAFELVRKALEGMGGILALHPENGAEIETGGLIEAAISSAKTAEWIRNRCHVPKAVARISVYKPVSQPSAARDALQVLLESEAAAVTPPLVGKTAEASAKYNEELNPSSLPAGLAHAAENTLRVDAGRMDTVMNLVGELIIGKSMLQRTIAEFEQCHSRDPLRGRFADALAFQSRILSELQKSVMKIRMVPVEHLFRRFPRVVRDVAKQRNKEIALEIAGQNTDLDKSLLDALAEPLAHLVRNAADHGIEPAADRQAAGKPVRGTIRLNAYHEGDQVVIEVSDDGHGLDREKIVRRAVERSILTPEQAAQLTESDFLQLIFAPGLSTADEVTEISGRGVGLDVVKADLENLKGTVKVETRLGHGTTFRLLLPLTLASIQALLFRVSGRLYAVPLSSVAEITRITEEEVTRVDHHEVFPLRGQILSLIRLHRLGPNPVKEQANRVFVIIMEAGNRRFGLAVDSLVGEEELVIKALEDHLVTSLLVSGASILGDGTVVLILNVPAVISHLLGTHTQNPVLGAIA